MPPPKLKLYKTGKLKTLNKPPTVAVASSSPNTLSELDSESVRQFELELAWCIQTMESSLNGGKLNASQGESLFIFILSTARHPFPISTSPAHLTYIYLFHFQFKMQQKH